MNESVIKRTKEKKTTSLCACVPSSDEQLARDTCIVSCILYQYPSVAWRELPYRLVIMMFTSASSWNHNENKWHALSRNLLNDVCTSICWSKHTKIVPLCLCLSRCLLSVSVSSFLHCLGVSFVSVSIYARFFSYTSLSLSCVLLLLLMFTESTKSQ